MGSRHQCSRAIYVLQLTNHTEIGVFFKCQLRYTLHAMKNYESYAELAKPFFAPPAWIFGPVWTVLYAIIIASFGYVGYLFYLKRIPFPVLLPFLLNVVFNLAFTPIQFGLKNLPLASLDILLVLGTLVWAMWVIFPHARWVAYANIPYLLWVSFATILQLTITWMNR